MIIIIIAIKTTTMKITAIAITTLLKIIRGEDVQEQDKIQ